MAGPGSPRGVLMRRLRVRAGLTQDELAALSGISVRAVRDIESGQVQQPRTTSLDRLATALRLSDDERQQWNAGATDRRFRVDILGPIVASRAGFGVRPGPPAQRTLLGLLALRRNEFVSHDEIIDVLWGDRPPRTCLSRAQDMFGRLRQLIEPNRTPRSPSETLRRLRGGYLLEIDDELIDAGRFTRLARRAHATSRAGDAIGVWTEALSCWRGPALADTHDRLRHHPAAVALARSRVDAVIAYADDAADAGRHEVAVQPLQHITAGEHHHEGLHARLIVALAHVGDRAAALRHFDAIQQRLAEDLGIGPGDRLWQARRAVLAMHPVSSVCLPPDAATTSPTVAPGVGVILA